ncbi:MAG: class I SAM-dependent methyltransferase [Chromatiales bacterium]|nr:MAG: class I SAM-dependent methyltransferase [Chromatiales bacterium]
MRSHWLETGTGAALLCAESCQVAAVFENIFGDQFLQIGAWGTPDLFRRSARTQRYAVVAADRGPGVDFVSMPEDLAVASDSIDAVFLPHVLETTEDPHAVLREVDRILRPDGHVVIAGFNSWGWWGLRHHLSRGRFPAGGQRMVSESRVRDWLNLLDYNVQPGRFHHMTAPVYRLRRPVERVADAKESDDGKCTTPAANYRGWNPLASCYLLVARREIFTVTPIRPKFRRRAQLVGSLINPTTRNSA